MSGRNGWSWFERNGDEALSIDGASALHDPDVDRDGALRKAYARCFSTPEGQRVMEHLRTLTLERVHGPDAPADLLRHIEGQRHLVAYIAALSERGRTRT